MRNNNVLNNGIPVSVSLNPSLEAEDFKPRRSDDKLRILFISFVALLLALVISCIAKLLVALIDLFTNISFFARFSFDHHTPAENHLGIWVIIVPVIGGLIVGFMALYGSKAIRGHGIPEAMEQILTNKSKIKPSIMYLKPLSAAISIGTGGPFGAEGPIIATGGAFGSTIGQLLRISNDERKILLAAGATAGMSAIFGSPVAAIFLAIELLLFEFSPRSLVPVAVACVTGAAGHHFLFGQAPVFSVKEIPTVTNTALALYCLLGIVIGFISSVVTKIVYFIEDLFEKLPVKWMWWPAIGGLVVGVVGYFDPKTLGVGYENISDILTGNMTLTFLISLCVLKFISWAVALGSGTSGGTLAPLLTIGGAVGAIAGIFILQFYPNCGVSIPLAGMIGMSAMFAGASRALLTSIIFAMETTGQSSAVLPLLGACIASYFVSFLLMKNTIMTEKIARRGVETPDSYSPDILEKVRVVDVMEPIDAVISEGDDLRSFREFIAVRKENADHSPWIVTDKNGELKGIADDGMILDAAVKNILLSQLVLHDAVPVAENKRLRSAVEIMSGEDKEMLVVTSASDPGVVVGIISYRNVLTVYREKYHADVHKEKHLSIRRGGMKLIIRGKRMMNAAASQMKLKRNERN